MQNFEYLFLSLIDNENICFVADNAYDPDVAATELTIDKKIIKSIPVLAFLDNGKGMVPEKLYKMLRYVLLVPLLSYVLD